MKKEIKQLFAQGERTIPESKEILAQENRLIFREFSNQDAWALAEEIMENYHAMTKGLIDPKEIGIRVVLKDLVVFQYLMEKKTEIVYSISSCVQKGRLKLIQ